MDGLSAVAGVATAGVQLSKFLYDLYSTVKASRQEIQDVANNVSLLAMVLEELDSVLCDDESKFKSELREAAQTIALRCASIFKDIRNHTGADPGLKEKKFYKMVAWYFKRERVKPLRSSLESLKSTLTILLHVVQLAKSTKGVEEYPGVKPIGQWCVRRERRGLLCLVIDNRHAVEKLKQFEDQISQRNLDLIENEQPVLIADIIPLSPSIRKRGQSPERKFVFAFETHRPRDTGGSRRYQELDISKNQAGPSIPNGDNFLLPFSLREHSNHPDLSVDSDAESICRSTSPQSARNPEARARPTKEQATSRLILDVIPHEEADETFKSTLNLSRSTVLEAKAEETIDTLMRQWTYVDPKYFSEDDRSSALSTEASLPLLRDEISWHSHEDRALGPTERSSVPYDSSRRRNSEKLEKKKPGDGQSKSLEEIPKTSSSVPRGRGQNSKERPAPLSPTFKDLQGDQGEKAKGTPHTPSDQGLQDQVQPPTPAPPYVSSRPRLYPSCRAVSPSVTMPNADKSTGQRAESQARDAETGNEASTCLDNALRLFENRILEKIKLASLEHATLETQPGQEAEQREHQRQSVITGQETEPVILKDCLGRKFLFPIQTCRSWQSMENLIRRSFSHVESMNSRIFRGSYDILSPTGEIVLPEIWEAVIKPGWVVELRFWDSAKAGHVVQKDPDVDDIGIASAVLSDSDSSSKPYMETSSDVQLVMAKRRTSMRTWFGSRKSTPSVVLE